MSPDSRQWKGTTGGGKFGQNFLFFVFRYVNVTVLYPVLLFVIPFYLLFAKEGRKAIYSYYHDVLGYTRRKSMCATVKNFYVFGKVVLDKFAMQSGKTEQFHISIENEPAFQDMLDDDKGFVIVSSHVGNFELAGHCLYQDKKQFYGVLFGAETETMKQHRTASLRRTHVNLIPIANDMSHIFAIKEALEKGGVVTILCDRMMGGNKKIKVNFLGKDAYFPIGTFILAAVTDSYMVCVFTMKEKKLDYTTYIFPLAVDKSEQSVNRRAEKMLRQYVKYLEDIVKKYPEQWFNYYDFWNLYEPVENK
ncbi:MAG: lysophospholipid acyltransferase family protein [Bacteroidales bacterium]|nr:lysophospholipid acyltransferase family protein [Bacteroidales bacterium]